MIRYEVVDMFADRAFTGCGVGVVPDASTLSDEQMLAVAREVNQTETAFVLPSSGPAASYRVRVFTPAGESPFGGHSSLGTAVTLVRLGLIPSGRVVQQCGAALLPLSVTGDRGVITSSAPVVSTAVDATVLLDVCGLTEADLADAEPRAAGFGAAFHFLPVLDDSVAKAEPRFPDFRAAGLKDVFAFAWDPVTRSAHSRMFAPGYGMPEDPACASAALGLPLVESPAVTEPAWMAQLANGIPAVVKLTQAKGDTCCITATDSDGNMVVATPSGGWLKSSPVVPGLGFPLGTRGQMAWLVEGHPNSLAPGKRPRTTLSPTLVLRDGRPHLAFGTPGGDQQDQWTLNFFLNHVVFGQGVQAAIEATAFHTDHVPSSFTPRSIRPRSVVVESACPPDVVAGLRARGHDVDLVADRSLGKVCATGASTDGMVFAAASPRGEQAYGVAR